MGMKSKPWQFSLAGMLALTAVIAAILGIGRLLPLQMWIVLAVNGICTAAVLAIIAPTLALLCILRSSLLRAVGNRIRLRTRKRQCVAATETHELPQPHEVR